MAQLLEMGFFRQVTLYDYQAMCKLPYHHHSGARSLLNPLFALISAAHWLFSNFVLFLLEFTFCSFWSSDNSVEAKSFFHHSHKHKKQDMLQPCDTEYPAFVHETSIKDSNGLIQCGHCQKMFVVHQVPHSNLLLLVSDSACDCSIFPPVPLQAKEVKYNASVKCDRMRSQKLRRRPQSCHAFHVEVSGENKIRTNDLPLINLRILFYYFFVVGKCSRLWWGVWTLAISILASRSTCCVSAVTWLVHPCVQHKQNCFINL
uniref:Voltage-dependent calcium channel alpha-2/delta subunit conserved region domain-containing protein n=1 Tax=Leptobrachium leishanense TaxID=445787 RepID=A0A8C5MT08_9ANUR